MQWEVVIGLETHTQLATKSKIFSGSSTRFGAEPNTQASPVDLALPGVLPVMNKEAVQCAIKFGLAVGATVAHESVFARKNYFYPDLPKGYQISQYEIPVVQGGSLDIVWEVDGEQKHKTVNLTRAHLEEDAGKSLHEDYHGKSGIDLNRAGTPLLEIVTEPEMRSSKEAVAYAKALHGLVTWLGICDGNMQEGSFRCDANVSVRPVGQKEFGTRCEIKNLNSFRFMERAIEYEIRRQIELIEDGGKVVQETRLYDPDKDETRSMRSKEDAQDYRYFPDPDLPALVIDQNWIAATRAQMPELPGNLSKRWQSEFGLSVYDATALTATREIAQYFTEVVAALPDASKQAKTAAHWVMVDLGAAANRETLALSQVPISTQQFALLVTRISDGTISGKIAKDIFAMIWSTKDDRPDAVDKLIDENGLKQITDTGALEAIVAQVLAANPKSVDEFKAGKDKALNALVGQVMKATQGKANPQVINELLRKAAGSLAPTVTRSP